MVGPVSDSLESWTAKDVPDHFKHILVLGKQLGDLNACE